MIYSLNGRLVYKDHLSAVIECSGVGYRFIASLKTLASLPEKGSNAFVYTYMNFKQDGVDLIGFADERELDAFKLIVSVNGVGPKLGVAILSEFTVDQLYLYIASGDSKSISRASGVGSKSAQRIVLELKDKIVSGDVGELGGDVAAVQSADSSLSARDAIAALVQFGYSQSEAAAAVGKCDKTLPTDQIIKQALKLLSTII